MFFSGSPKVGISYLKPLPVEYVLHQAALGSIPRSLTDPIAANETNIMGFLNMLVAARDAKANSFTYASSSSTYGDHPALPKVEENIGKLLNPYSVTKYVNELYAEVFAYNYGFNTIGLRYFNVFGQRQNPTGAYAAVIPKWTSALLRGEPVYINGDGETSRDFCFVANAVQANVLAATASFFKASEATTSSPFNQVYNIALGDRTSLKDLFKMLKSSLQQLGVETESTLQFRDFRPGDVRHSQADIKKAIQLLDYEPIYRLAEGVAQTMIWYLNQHQSR